MDVIAERGYAGATQRSIAQRAGVPPASTHYFFSSVDDLARKAAAAHLQRRAGYYEEFIDTFLAERRSVAEGCREMAEVMSAVAVEMRLAQFEIYLNARRHPAIKDTVLECLARFEAVAVRAMGAAGVRHPERWGKALLALGDGFAMQRVAGAGSATDAFEQAIRALMIVAMMDDDERAGWNTRLESAPLMDRS